MKEKLEKVEEKVKELHEAPNKKKAKVAFCVIIALAVIGTVVQFVFGG